MAKQVFIVPRKGLLVRDPLSFTPIPEAGQLVDYVTFWRRRIRQGDVVIKEQEQDVQEAQEVPTETNEYKSKRSTRSK